MKLKDINISFRFLMGCLIMLGICISMGFYSGKLLFSMILFIFSICGFILLELIILFLKIEPLIKRNTQNKSSRTKNENKQ